MTITRTAWTDDDGTNSTGTVLNNAVKTELYNQIDAALAAGWTVVSPTDVGAQNDYTPGLVGHTVIRMNNATAVTISGFAGGTSGQRVRVISIGAGQVNFVHQATSTAANRLINLATSANTSLAAGVGTAEYVYDATTLRWRMVMHDQGATIAYTPTWTGAGSNPVLNNGTLAGKFYLMGRQLRVDVYVLMGSSTTYGTGAYSFSLPYTAMAIDSGVPPSGLLSAFVFDNGTNYLLGMGQTNSTTTLRAITHGASDYVGATVPITFTTGDAIRITGDVVVT